ncbi:MAG: uroporphyrinogen-III synthase [Pyrinomonadaceae bacterium]
MKDIRYGLIASQLNKSLALNLRAKGGEILEFPAVAALPITDNTGMFCHERYLSSFDLLILTDIYAAEILLDSLEAASVKPFFLDELHLCSFGESVADRLRFRSIHSDIVPRCLETESVYGDLAAFFGNRELGSLNVLVFDEPNDESELAATLSGHGANVTTVQIYENCFSEADRNSKLRALLKGGAVDKFLFTAIEDVIALRALFPGESIKKVLEECEVAATNGQVYRHLCEYGLLPELFDRT